MSYCRRMQRLLGEEYQAYMDSLQQKPCTALRVNTAKISLEKWREICPFETEQVAWNEKGFLTVNPEQKPAKHPYYYAGLYYIQEPSAMIPADILPVHAGDRLLDLCAAPGGKATELAARLNGSGELVANDISVSRGMALAKNLQLAGAVNAVVTAETPEKLSEHFPEYFDGILVDAPCSGEGMFRRDSHMIQDWVEHGPDYYEEIQRGILDAAFRMLKSGGYLVYSTCTFSPQEDEEMVLWLLRKYPEMKVCLPEKLAAFAAGRPDWVEGDASLTITEEEREQLRRCIRIFPHKASGEGHFAVLLQKGNASSQRRTGRGSVAGKDESGASLSIAKSWTSLAGIPDKGMTVKNGKAVLKATSGNRLGGLRCLQTGLIAGQIKKRFEPSVQLALAIRDITAFPRVLLQAEDIRVMRYLKGETLQEVSVEGEKQMKLTDRFVLICVDGFPLGWGKYMGNGTVRNKYYAGWRMQ